MQDIGTHWYSGYKLINAEEPSFARIYHERSKNHYG